MTAPAVPPEAVTAARAATDRAALDALGGLSGLSLAAQRDYLLRAALEAAAPHLAAVERERCARLAEQYHTTWLEPCDADDHERGLHTHHRRPFAALLREQP